MYKLLRIGCISLRFSRHKAAVVKTKVKVEKLAKDIRVVKKVQKEETEVQGLKLKLITSNFIIRYIIYLILKYF